MSALFSPIDIGKLSLPNRIVVSPICQYTAREGRAHAWHLVHLGGLANSGAGLVMIEATAVESIGRATPGDLGLWCDETEAALQVVTSTVRQVSDVSIGLQLSHAGRKASVDVPWLGGKRIDVKSGGWIPAAPSAVAYRRHDPPPSELNYSGLARIRKAFTDAAVRAHRIGVDALEIHGGHGYLLHQFLSPISNRRKDRYGGSLENRIRFPLELFDAVRSAFPMAKPVGVKLAVSDHISGGWDVGECHVLIDALTSRGVDWVSVSSGGIAPRSSQPTNLSTDLLLAAKISKETSVRVIASGGIQAPNEAEAIVATGQAPLVGIARAFLYNPRWAWHAAFQLDGVVDAAPSYRSALRASHPAIFRSTR